MNIKKIKAIVNNPCADDSYKEVLILQHLAETPEAINDLLRILAIERSNNKALIEKMNFLVSTADKVLQVPELREPANLEKRIEDFYKQNPSIKHLFKME